MKTPPPLLLLLIPLAACSSVRVEPWIENGREIGEIHIREVGGGLEYAYYDREERLMQFEDRDANGNLTPSSRIGKNRYDGDRLAETRFYSPDGQPAAKREGHAIIRYEYNMEDRDAPHYDVLHLGLDEQPVQRTDGYSCERIFFLGEEDLEYTDGEQRLWKSEYYSADGSRASVTLNGVANTSYIEYSYLEGIGPMVFVTHFNAAGEVIHKRRLSGIVEQEVVHRTTTTFY